MLRPHYYVTLLITSGDKVLVYQATRQPLEGKIGLPSGKLHYGDSSADRLKAEVDRRQLTDDFVATSICPINIRYRQDGGMIMHRPGTLWHIDYNGPLLDSRTDSGQAVWMDQAKAMADPTVLPELREGLRRLTDKSSEPIDMVYDLG